MYVVERLEPFDLEFFTGFELGAPGAETVFSFVSYSGLLPG